MTTKVMGRQCSACGKWQINPEPDDLYCDCTHLFAEGTPLVAVPEEALKVDEDQLVPGVAPVAVPAPPAPAARPVAPPAPVVVAPIAAPVAAAPAAGKRHSWLDIKIDHGQRPDKDMTSTPADLEEGTFKFPAGMDKFEFGREKGMGVVNCVRFAFKGDEVVSRFHGTFHRRADGGFDIENVSQNGSFIKNAANPNGGDITGKGRIQLHDGDVIEVGDWYTLVYHEASQQ